MSLLPIWVANRMRWLSPPTALPKPDRDSDSPPRHHRETATGRESPARPSGQWPLALAELQSRPAALESPRRSCLTTHRSSARPRSRQGLRDAVFCRDRQCTCAPTCTSRSPDDTGRVGFPVSPSRHRNHPLVAALPLVARATPFHLEGHLSITAAHENDLSHRAGSLFHGVSRGEAELARPRC